MALLATHGHFDHIGDAHLLAARLGIPCTWPRPTSTSSPAPARASAPRRRDGGAPDRCSRRACGGRRPRLHGALRGGRPDRRTVRRPGHTAGSTLLSVSDGEVGVVFTGDVLFSGTIGRTDLPGGNMTAMRETLTRIVGEFPGTATLLPGMAADRPRHRDRLQPVSSARDPVRTSYATPQAAQRLSRVPARR
ncbi:MBL fold metallo-hydrolase [Tessaracoccus sp. HDW20]|nr:MBL fold metallo-hydrolase [Tessaracoccus coleopterorum]